MRNRRNVIAAAALVMLPFAVPALAQPEMVCTPIPDAQNGSAGPVDPTTCATYNGPFTQPAIFFAAHPDDETLGMSGSIHQALAAGRTVVVELMTRGTASGALGTLCGEPTSGSIAHTIACDDTHYEDIMHPAPSPATRLGCSDTDGFGNARVREFMDSMRRLGVQAIAIHDYPDGGLPAQKVTARAQYWINRGFAGMSLYGTAGSGDYPYQHVDHEAVHDGLSNTGYAPRTFLSVYSGGICDAATRRSDAHWSRTISLGASDCSARKNALAAYRVWNDAAGRYAVGWFHSTGYLFESDGATGANDDCTEYVTDEVAGAAPGCGEATCVNPDGQYISHFTGPNCNGTESYYLPYDGYAYLCRPFPSTGAQCGTIHRTVTNSSYRYNGQCYPNAWPGGNTLSNFVTVYRTSAATYCGEASCVSPDGDYISHFTGPNCNGTESYYLPYDGYAYHCRPESSAGVRCGTVHRTVTNYSYRYQGQCHPNAWPNGNTLSDFVAVYR